MGMYVYVIYVSLNFAEEHMTHVGRFCLTGKIVPLCVCALYSYKAKQ